MGHSPKEKPKRI